MKALIFVEPPHFGQSSGSSSKTFFMSRAQLANGLATGLGSWGRLRAYAAFLERRKWIGLQGGGASPPFHGRGTLRVAGRCRAVEAAPDIASSLLPCPAVHLRTAPWYRGAMHGRPTCYRCYRPESHCVCGLVPPFEAHCGLLVLQHPHERRKYYSTARLDCRS